MEKQSKTKENKIKTSYLKGRKDASRRPGRAKREVFPF